MTPFAAKTPARTLSFRHRALLCAFVLLACAGWAQVNVLTHKVDNSRAGQNTSETLLTTANVNSTQFGKLYALNVDGYVSAQPLYMSNLAIAGGSHNVVFVATQHDSVYAFDADTGAQYWQTSFINPTGGVTTVPMTEQGCGGVTGFSEVGIVSTPTVDAATGTLYVTAKTKEVVGSTTSYFYRLHALDVTTGLEKFGGPTVISAAVSSLTFNTLNHLQRPGILLLNGTLYLAFGSNGCDLSGRGWVMAYNATTLQQSGVMVLQPDSTYGSSVWQSGVGLSADSAGNVYLATANGVFSIGAGFPDLGDSVVKLSLGANGLTATDYFTPFDQANMQSQDLDLGSGGPIVLPDQAGAFPHLLVQIGKTGAIYVINRDNMGQYNPINNNQIPQYIAGATAEFFGAPMYWNNNLYFLAHLDYLKAYSITNGVVSSTATAQTSSKLTTIGLPVISSNGSANGIVWLARNVKNVPLLSAYDAGSLALLYDSGMAAASRDLLGTVPHFATPVVANGKVFAGTQTQVVVYGLFPTLAANAGNNQSGAVGTTLPTSLTVLASNPYTGSPVSGVSVTFSDNGAGGSFSSSVVITDSAGKASTRYTLPTAPKTVSISATSAGYTTANFTETATTGAAASIVLTSGGKQTGTVGTTLPAPIVFKAKDSFGNPVSGVPITFSDGGKGGSFSASVVNTDSTGQASSTYTLPTKNGYVTITGSNGSLSATASVQALVGTQTTLKIVSGNKQTAPPGTQLPAALVCSVKDQYGNAMQGLTVNWTDNGAGGTLSSPTSVTNGSGQASVNYTTPGTTGTVTVSASTTVLGPLNFTVTVQ